MALQRITGRDCLNVSSDSPFLKRKVPLLGTSPWCQRRFLTKPASSKPSPSLGLSPGRFGTPSYPSSLDRLTHDLQDARERANASFSHLPRPKLKTFVKQPKGNDLHSFSFSQSFIRGSFDVVNEFPDPKDTTMTKGHWELRSFVGLKPPNGEIVPRSILNPNKLVLTVDAAGSIVAVNDVALYILCHTEEEICKMKLDDFITNAEVLQMIKSALKNSANEFPSLHSSPVVLEGNDSAPLNVENDVVEGEGMVLFSGKVIYLKTKEVDELPVSLWMKRLDLEENEEPKWLAVLEPVHIVTSKIIIDSKGSINDADAAFLDIFLQQKNIKVQNRNILEFIPSLDLPQGCNLNEIQIHQNCAGKASDESSFPLSLVLGPIRQEGTSGMELLFEMKIQVCLTISGLVVVDEQGLILDYNHNFTRHLFGYGFKELNDKCITEIIPCFEKFLNSSKIDEPEIDIHPIHPEMDDDKDIDVPKIQLCDANSTTLPYIDDSKENLFDSENSKSKLASITQLSRINSENSSMSLNRAFLGSESQLTNSNSSCLTTSKSLSHKTTSDNQSSNQVSFNQNSTTGKDSQESICSPTKTFSSPHHNQAMKDITNSIKFFGISDQYGDDSELPINHHSLITSTPAVHKFKQSCPVEAASTTIPEGSFCGIGKHKDGSNIVVTYQIKQVVIGDCVKYCIWILWEPENNDATCLDMTGSFSLCNQNNSWFTTPRETSRRKLLDDLAEKESEESDTESSFYSSTSHPSHTSTEGTSEGEYSLHHSRVADEDKVKVKLIKANESIKDQTTLSLVEENEDILMAGEYGEQYSILRQIGKGAFGCVKLSYRNKDGLMVVTKFIRKNKVYKDSWEEDCDTGKRVPLEIALLRSLEHPNIVSVIDYFENEDYFQLVMEKFGAGMDLFEFIDRNPILDEPLASYIFRQIISAIVYLRTKSIIHGDIKDENVIINQYFHVKLIDFGSATYLKEGQVFSQFAGTVEYCSPEVIKGYKYTGPELEVWSLGITLYTLLYGENPFYDIDEILKSSLHLPIVYSDDLEDLLSKMLVKNPKERILLEDVALHPWTNQRIEINKYKFEEVVDCTEEELNPKSYIADYSRTEVSLSTTSSSFVYEGRSFSCDPQRDNSHLEQERHHQRSYTTLSPSPSRKRSDELLKDIDVEEPRCGDDFEEDSASVFLDDDSSLYSHSRSSTTQSISSLRSTVTIDSSLLTFSSTSYSESKVEAHPHSPDFDADLSTDDSRSSSRLSSSTFSDLSDSTYPSSQSGSSDSSIEPTTLSLECSSEEETLATTPPYLPSPNGQLDITPINKNFDSSDNFNGGSSLHFGIFGVHLGAMDNGNHGTPKLDPNLCHRKNIGKVCPRVFPIHDAFCISPTKNVSEQTSESVQHTDEHSTSPTLNFLGESNTFLHSSLIRDRGGGSCNLDKIESNMTLSFNNNSFYDLGFEELLSESSDSNYTKTDLEIADKQS